MRIYKQGTKVWEEITKSAGRFDVGQKFFAFVILGGVAVISVLMYAVVLYAKIALSLVLAIGPVFIALALFEKTRSFTQSWVGALMNFVLLQVLLYALLGLLLKFLDSSISATSGSDPVSRGVSIIILCILSLFVTSQLPGISSSLAGSGFAIGQGVIGKLAGGAVAVARGAGRGAASTFRGGKALAARVQASRSNDVSKR